MDERGKLLLLEILKNPTITTKELQGTYNLTRRQVDYSLEKVNNWLQKEGKPQIKRKQGQYKVAKSVADLFDHSSEFSSKREIVPTQSERVILIGLFLLIYGAGEYLSLHHFTDEMQVSKNTILQDFKDLSKLLEDSDLRLNYSRSTGYVIIGQESNKRRLMLRLIYKAIKIHGGIHYLENFLGLTDKLKKCIEENIVKIENELNLSFVDREYETLLYAVESIFQRVINNHYIETEFYINNKELSDTREYDAVEILVADLENYPEEERVYLTLQLLTSNSIQEYDPLEGEKLSKLREVLRETLVLFEKTAVLPIPEKEELVNKLFLHFKPAYYRIKYNLTTDYQSLGKVSDEFQMVYEFVKKSINPLEEFLQCKIPEDELMFIALFVGGHILGNNNQTNIEKIKKAVIVCPNGVSVSKLMKKNLKEIFPEIYFYPPMSVREFHNTELEYDAVFSSTPIRVNQDIQLYVMNQIISKNDRYRLRQHVIKTLFKKGEIEVDLDRIMKIIREYTEVIDEDKLITSLAEIIYPENQVNIYNSQNLHLDELITENMIQLVDEVQNWHQAIELASKPLLDTDKISNEYVRAMKNDFPTLAEHIMLQNNIAIPHSAIDKGVNELGMSMLIVKKGIPNNLNKQIHFVVVIAAVDKESHFTSLLELMELAGEEEFLKRMRGSTQSQEVAKLIQLKIIEEIRNEDKDANK